MDDSDVSVERLAIRDAEVWLAIDVFERFGFDCGRGSSIARVAIQSLDNEVMTKESFAASSFRTAHRMEI